MAKHRERRHDQKHSKSGLKTSKVLKPQHKQKKKQGRAGQLQQQHGVIPYLIGDRILLIGEGDFSFACSLLKRYGCRHVTATCFDSEQELAQKYPQAKEATSYLLEKGQRVLYGVDATKLSQKIIRRPPLPPAPTKSDDQDARNVGLNDEVFDEHEHSQSDQERYATPSGPRGWDVITFNFPHVGGKSTDVNRQTRHNQSLLMAFFSAALPLLTPPCPSHPAGGVVLVTLFEGEPYTLWNVKDLGRHAGLRTERSWKFDWGAYPGYRHARTLGNIEGGGGWKGEERAARTYAFVGKDAPNDVGLFEKRTGMSRKRRKDESSEEEDG